MIQISDVEFELLRDFLCSLSGIEIPHNKRYLFQTRLSVFLEQKGFTAFSTLYHQMAKGKNKQLQEEFVQSMTTHESSFFRDSYPFELLEKKLLPEIAGKRISEAQYLPPRIRILSAGCSMGQEPYSIAIIVRKWLKTQGKLTIDNITIRGTDISQKVIDAAKRGRYLALELGKQLSSGIMRTYFIQEGSQWFIKDEIKNMVTFAEVNLANSINELGKFDIIFCRNVIIYFPIALKKKILSQFHRILNPGGALIMGASESMYNLNPNFQVVKYGSSNYYTPGKPSR